MKSIVFFLIFTFSTVLSAFSYPINFTDKDGNHITIEKQPTSVVSVVPAITEIIFRIGAGDALKGITYHDSPETVGSSLRLEPTPEIVGGFFSPDLNIIRKISPDIIFISDLHKNIIKEFQGKCKLIHLKSDSVSEIYKTIELLGQIFDKKDNALKIIDEIKSEIQHISNKIAKIPESKRKRVIRLMGRDTVMTPGDDSFQNEYIRLAGGIAPKLNKNGNIVQVSKEEWIKFNPQIIYGCGNDRELAKKFFDLPGWKDVDAVKNKNIFYFPCDLTCRASTHAGHFISCLASRIYEDEFIKKENQVIEDKILKSIPLSLDLDYVKDIQIIHTYIYDFIHKTLIIELNQPMPVVSTLEGYREGIKFVGNSYSPAQVWGIYHKISLDDSRAGLYKVLNKQKENTSILFTGADMDKLSIKKEKFKDMDVYAIVTAGVESNAVKMSKDIGLFYEPGTINMILMTNMKLTPRAMTRAVISATEGKSAALNDMDIRSSYSGMVNQATGTGTDNIIVVQGTGTEIDNAGGHTKMGELIAKAVYHAVQDAIYKQNGLTKKRNIFKRLKERHISLSDLIGECDCNLDKKALFADLEKILLEPSYAAFLEAVFAVSDDYEQGQITDLNFFRIWCNQITENIAGHKIENPQNFFVSGEEQSSENIPDVLKMGLNALLNGISAKMK